MKCIKLYSRNLVSQFKGRFRYHKFLIAIKLCLILCSNPVIAHTNSIGFQTSASSAVACAVGAGANCVNIEVFMGTYHGSSAAEGHAALFLQNGDGTESQVLGQSAPGGVRISFTTSHSLLSELPNFDGSNYWDVGSEAYQKLATQFDLGTNYFFADGSNSSLTSTPSNPNLTWGSFPYIRGHQSATFDDVGSGIYRLDYDAGAPQGKASLGFDWYALPGISEAFFRVQADGTVSIVMNPEKFLEFAQFSRASSLNNAALALNNIRPSIRTTATEVGAFFEEIYKMPIKTFYQNMKSISGDIHGQVHYTLLSDLGLNSSIEMNNFSLNRENKETWFYVNELSSSQIEVAQSVGNTVSGTAVSIGRNWQFGDDDFPGVSISFAEQKLIAPSGVAKITSSNLNFFYSKTFKEFEVNNILTASVSNVETIRKVVFDTSTNLHTANYDYKSISAKSEVSKSLKLAETIETTTAVGYAHQLSVADDFSENGQTISKLAGQQEKAELQGLFVGQEVAFKPNSLGLDIQFSLGAVAHKQILNSVGREARTVSLHEANWEVGSPFREKLTLETEARLSLILNEVLKINVGGMKRFSSSNTKRAMFSVSAKF